MKVYKTSVDFKLLKKLLDSYAAVVGFYRGMPIRIVRCGFEYNFGDIFTVPRNYSFFERYCEQKGVSFIEPTEEA